MKKIFQLLKSLVRLIVATYIAYVIFIIFGHGVWLFMINEEVGTYQEFYNVENTKSLKDSNYNKDEEWLEQMYIESNNSLCSDYTVDKTLLIK